MKNANFVKVPASTREVLAFHIAKALNDTSNLDLYLRAANRLSSLHMLSILKRLSDQAQGLTLVKLYRQEISH